MAKHIPMTAPPLEPEPEVAKTASTPALIGEPVLPVSDQRKTTRGLNPELQAMAKIDRILAELGFPAQARIINWLQSRAMEAEDADRAKTNRGFFIETGGNGV